MGFVDAVLIHGEQVEVRLALDDPCCPVAEYFVEQIRRKVKGLNGIQRVEGKLLDNGCTAGKVPMKELVREGLQNG